jgi:glycosyltransferase involved in cell wall biosynthesis
LIDGSFVMKKQSSKLAFSFLCENPQHQTGGMTFFREYLVHSLKHFEDLEWIVFAGPNQEFDFEHPRLRYIRDFRANDQMKARLWADHFRAGPVARRLGAAGLFTIGFVPVHAPLPVFMGVNALLHTDKENCPGFFRRWYRGWNIRHGVRRASLVITNSAFTASRLRKEYPECVGKLVVSHEGTLPEFTPDRAAGETEALEKALQVKPGYLLWVSNFHHYKQAPLFLEGYADLPAGVRARMPVVMVGGDWGGAAAVNELIKTRNLQADVRVLGWVDAKWIAPLFRHALAYVLPSREETFGRTITEALSSGTPCVLNDIPIAHEISGGHALIIDFNNRALVTTTLRRLVDEPALREQIRIGGLAQAKRFSFERMAIERVGAVREWLRKNAGSETPENH